MNPILGLALLACAVAACGDRQSPVAPANLTPAAAASTNSGAPEPLEDSYISNTCGFPVRVDSAGTLKVLPLPDGRLKVLFPGFTTTFTNLDTDKQVSVTNPGSFHIRSLPNGNTEILYTGRNTYDDPTAGSLVLLIGQFTELYDPDFNLLQPLQGSGQIVNLCQALV